MTSLPLRVFATLLLGCALCLSSVGSAVAAAKPLPATGVKVSTTTSTATISWKPATGASSYRVCLQAYADQSPCARISRRSASTKVTFRSLKPTSGTDYYVVVYSYRGSNSAKTHRKGFNLTSPPAPDAPAPVVREVSSNSFTVSWGAARGADDYDVCLMTSGDTSTCAFRSPRSTTRTATFDDLVPTSGTDYYVRVYAHNAGGSTPSVRYSFNLPVGAIASASMTRQEGTSRVPTRWTAAINAEQYEVQFGTNPSMTTGLKTYTVDQPSATFTRLTLGTTYHYRVRGINGAVKGAWTPNTRFRMASDPTDVVVITYNLCGQDKCVSKTNGVGKWSTRKAHAGRIARSAKADVIATQESHHSETRFGTELPGFTLGAYYSAKSLFFDEAKYDKQRSGVITLDSTRRKYAVWVQLRDVTTGTIFIVGDAHLQHSKGRSNDLLREAQTKKLIQGVARINPNNFPVIYAGDYNSNKSNTQPKYPGGFDAPLKVFTAAGILDVFDIAAKKVNSQWNSANQAKNPPIKHFDHVDHVYLDPSIEALEFKVIVSVETVGDQTLYKTPFATDHNPVRAKVRVPGH